MARRLWVVASVIWTVFAGVIYLYNGARDPDGLVVGILAQQLALLAVWLAWRFMVRPTLRWIFSPLKD